MSIEKHSDHPGQDKKKYHFKIDNTPYTWDQRIITGTEIRSVGPGIPESMDLFVKIKGKPGRLVANDDKLDLSDEGIEKFYSQESSSSAGGN
jgi:hypothetical protein